MRAGQLLRYATIDWEAVEANPRQAKELITKSNLFGKVDWGTLRETGMDPGAAFLVDRVYGGIGKEPPEDSPLSRQDYARGIESVRGRLETCKTPDEVTQTLDEMRDEYRGVMLAGQDAEDYQAARAEFKRLADAYAPIRKRARMLGEQLGDLMRQQSQIKYDDEKRAKRKQARDPDLDAQLAAIAEQQRQVGEDLRAFRAEHPGLESKRRELGNGWTANDNDYEFAIRLARNQADAILQQAQARNILGNPVTRAWIALGPKFHAILTGKSEAFAGHRANVRAGKVTDWSWAEKEGTSGPKTTQRAAQFQLQVADQIERVGGTPVTARSTQELKDLFGLRDIQSGNWVLNDPESAQWHVQQAAGAFMDLSDLLGVAPKTVAMNGRLALAFGARGTGNAGFGGGARAHYEHIERVINITKMKGGGALAHEWFHSLDNLIAEAHGARAVAGDMASESPAVRARLPPAVAAAWEQLHAAMHAGERRATRTLEISEQDRRSAKLNLGDRPRSGLPERIQQAGSLDAAIEEIDRAEEANAARVDGYPNLRIFGG